MPRPVIGVAPSIRHRPARGDAYVLYANYAAMVSRAGGLPFLLPLASTREEASEYLGRVDGLLLTGGNDIDPALYGQAARPATTIGPRSRVASDLLLARAAQERGVPALGVCLGIQVMNVAFGGTLLQHIPEDVPGALRHEEEGRVAPEHPVRIEPGSLLARVLGVEAAVVNSYHHQAVGKAAPGFRVSARCPSDGIVEAIERGDHPFYLGVQWHPERMLDSAVTERLLRAFVDAARVARRS
jgi:putative glutamine amidotransferase